MKQIIIFFCQVNVCETAFGALRHRYYSLNDKQRRTSFQNISLSIDWKSILLFNSPFQMNRVKVDSGKHGINKGVAEEQGEAGQRDAKSSMTSGIQVCAEKTRNTIGMCCTLV